MSTTTLVAPTDCAEVAFHYSTPEERQKLRKIVEQQLLYHDIRLRQYRAGTYGRSWADRSVQLPKPINPEKICVCLYEIGLVILAPAYVAQPWLLIYRASQFALEIAARNGYDTRAYEQRARRDVLLSICKNIARGLDLNAVCAEVRAFVAPDVNLSEWHGRRVRFYEWGREAHLPLQPIFLD